MEEDLAYKTIVIGSVSVGKSNITCRFCDNAFYPETVPTLVMDFKYTTCETLEKNPRSVRLQIWDTSGQDNFVTLTTAFYRNCQGALLCFDLTNRSSFEDLDTWYGLLQQYCTTVPPLLLVGCKLDLVQGTVDDQHDGIVLGSYRQVSKSEADAWARQHHCLCYLETSAKENTNVSLAFQQLATFVAQNANPGAGGQRGAIGGRGRPLKADTESEGGTARKKPCCES